MDYNLHQQKGLEHLQKVIQYAPFVEENGHATVGLTQEDFQVLADTLFQMDTPKEMLPPMLHAYRFSEDGMAIELEMEAPKTIRIEMF